MRALPLTGSASPSPACSGRRSGRPLRWLAAAGACLLALPALAADRTVEINAPKAVATGSPVSISVRARTDVGQGERIGFFHAQYSADGGKTWTAFCFQEKLGSRATRATTIVAGPAGTKVIVRVRIAFRGGPDGDVDYAGNPIDWDNSWDKWAEPPAKSATIDIVPL